MKAQTIESVADLLEIVKHHSNQRFLYRGQDTDEPLLPRFARLAAHLRLERLQMVEDAMMERFKKESQPYLRDTGASPSSELDWLTIAQHYGLPTRLLDWTENPFAALWFVVEKTISKKKGERTDGVLWRLNFDEEDIIYASQHSHSVTRLTRTRVFEPFHISPRISAQSSWFSVHKYDRERDRFVPLDQNKFFKSKLSKYLIPKEHHDMIHRDLLGMGIKTVTLFPDPVGLCGTLEIDLRFGRVHVPGVGQRQKKGG